MRALLPATLLLLAALVAAQEAPPKEETPKEETPREETPKGPDAASRQLLGEWEARLYHPGRVGVKKVSHDILATLTLGEHKLESKGAYAWDGQKGVLTWENEQVGRMLAQQGWPQATFDGLFQNESMLETFAGATLTAKREAQTGTVVTVEGHDRVRRLQFDAHGVLISVLMSANTPMGALDVTVTYTYTPIGEKLARTGWVVSIPGLDRKETGTMTYEKVGAFHLPARAEVKTVMGGSDAGTKVLVFSNYKVNDGAE